MYKPFFILTLILSSYLHSQTLPIYEIYALKFAARGPTPISELALRGPDNDSVNLVFILWLVKGSNEKNILVDAGFMGDVDEAKEMNVINYIRPDSVLLELGIKPDEITDIILTHPHWDHADGISLFPKAHIWIQKDDYTYFIGEAWQKDGNNGGFDKRDVRKLVDLNLAGRLTLVDGDDREIIPGIKVYTGSRAHI